VVPVGKDQVQHLEFARDWATKFNQTYVPGYDPADPEGKEPGHAPGILKLPRVRLAADAEVVPGVDGQKMSKSYGNTIEMFADEKDVKKKIMGIKTDSTPVEAPKPVEGNALYQLLKVMAPPAEFAEIDASWRAGGKGYGDYKKKLLECFHATFGEARKRHAELSKDPAEVERILQDGAARARAIATPYVAAVRKAVGLA
jgi:tryptophanyl-tRNA synthetase